MAAEWLNFDLGVQAPALGRMAGSGLQALPARKNSWMPPVGVSTCSRCKRAKREVRDETDPSWCLHLNRPDWDGISHVHAVEAGKAPTQCCGKDHAWWRTVSLEGEDM